MLDAKAMQNDPNYTPLGANNGLLATQRSDEGVFIVAATTLRNRNPFGRLKYWLTSPVRLVRGGGRP